MGYKGGRGEAWINSSHRIFWKRKKKGKKEEKLGTWNGRWNALKIGQINQKSAEGYVTRREKKNLFFLGGGVKGVFSPSKCRPRVYAEENIVLLAVGKYYFREWRRQIWIFERGGGLKKKERF
jgi:hypothetical protein